MKTVTIITIIAVLSAWIGSQIPKHTEHKNAARYVVIESDWKDTREDALRDAKLKGFIQLVDIQASTYTFQVNSTKRKGGAFSVKMHVSCE